MNEDILTLGPRPELTVEPASAPVSDTPTDPSPVRDAVLIPEKLAFKIGEVADLVGVKTYVLRYWETEFDVLRLKKSKHGQRMYERKDVENLLLIKKLLYVDRFSIEGAQVALKKLRQENVRAKSIKTVATHIEDIKDLVLDMISEIDSLRQILN